MDRYETVRGLSDKDLIDRVKLLATEDRKCTVRMLVHLGEMDQREIAKKLGYPSIFSYCTNELRFAEALAYWRIHTARAARTYPILLDLVESGKINISSITLLCPVLTDRNHLQIIEAACGKTRKEVEAYVAGLAPGAPRRDVVTIQGPMIVARAQWPQPQPSAPASAAPPQAPSSLDIIEAVDAERRRLHFDVGPDTAELIERAREILRHKYPLASLEDIVREALNVLLDDKDLDRSLGKGRAAGDPTDGRRIPNWVRRVVWKRDEGCCAYKARDGNRRCGERAWLEFDHIVPFAQGGRSDDPANVRLLCRAHNLLEAARAFAPERPPPPLTER